MEIFNTPMKMNTPVGKLEMDKGYKTDEYMVLFNSKTGFELMSGINGHKDPFSLDYPSMIDIGIMGHCKNKCSFCYQGDKHQPNMKLDDFKSIIDQSKDFVMQIAIGGRGDPNHHENFKEILEYSLKNKVIPNYTTSGIDLTDEQVEISKMCGAVAVSNYGEEHTYKALKMFMDAGIKTNVHYVFTRESAGAAIDSVQGKDIWEGMIDLKRLNAVVFLLFKPQGRGKNKLDLIPDITQVKVFGEMIKDPKCDFKVGMDSCLFNKISKTRRLTPTEQVLGDTCEAGRCSCYISPDMKFMPCSFADHDAYGFPLEGIKIEKVWTNGDAFKQAREQLWEDGAKCPYGL